MDEFSINPTSSPKGWGSHWRWPALTFVLAFIAIVMTLLLITANNDAADHLAVQIGHGQREGTSSTGLVSTSSSTPVSLAAADVTTSPSIVATSTSTSAATSGTTTPTSSPTTTASTGFVSPGPLPTATTTSTLPTVTCATLQSKVTGHYPLTIEAYNGKTICLHKDDTFFLDVPVPLICTDTATAAACDWLVGITPDKITEGTHDLQPGSTKRLRLNFTVTGTFSTHQTLALDQFDDDFNFLSEFTLEITSS